jgi:hypothetical protein
MALLTNSSRRFTRTNNYSHQQRRLQAQRVHERIDVVRPGGPSRSRDDQR